MVVLPLGEERKGCIRVVHHLGNALADAGGSLLVFDCFGCGESPGDFSVVTWPMLTADASAALAFAANLAPGRPLNVLAIRTGALIALDALGSRSLHSLCLWEPVLDGARWLKELTRRSRFRGTGYAQEAHPDGALDMDGFVFSSSLVSALKAGTGGEQGREATRANRNGCRLIQIGHQDTPRPALKQGADALGAEVICVKMLPFWLEQDVVACAAAQPLITATMECLR